MKVDFSNTEIAFRRHSNFALARAYILFTLINQTRLSLMVNKCVVFLLKYRAPISKLIKQTVFHHFCGGETVAEGLQKAHELYKHKVSSILDYAAEGKVSEAGFNSAAKNLEATIELAALNKPVSYAVFKPTAIGSAELYAKRARGDTLSPQEEREWQGFRRRFEGLCAKAASLKMRIFIDAEDSWYQSVIDDLAYEMMKRYNRGSACVFNTLQMYRHDRLEHLKETHRKAKADGIVLGYKLVRGAYLEAERARAQLMGYPSPIHESKEATDRSYNDALTYCVENIDSIAVNAGTHNEESAHHLINLMEKHNISPDDRRCEFAQLLGMSDHITFNLAANGYLASKYVPYGPIREVMPYLLRRVEENTSIQGQMGRELRLIIAERKRRRS